MKKEIRDKITKLPTLKERVEAYTKQLDSMSNKELLCSLELNHIREFYIQFLYIKKKRFYK